jgi:hypothetical protein
MKLDRLEGRSRLCKRRVLTERKKQDISKDLDGVVTKQKQQQQQVKKENLESTINSRVRRLKGAKNAKNAKVKTTQPSPSLEAMEKIDGYRLYKLSKDVAAHSASSSEEIDSDSDSSEDEWVKPGQAGWSVGACSVPEEKVPANIEEVMRMMRALQQEVADLKKERDKDKLIKSSLEMEFSSLRMSRAQVAANPDKIRTILQRVVRGFLGRQRCNQIVRRAMQVTMAIRIQSLWRAVPGRQRLALALQAIRLMQRTTRGWLARKHRALQHHSATVIAHGFRYYTLHLRHQYGSDYILAQINSPPNKTNTETDDEQGEFLSQDFINDLPPAPSLRDRWQNWYTELLEMNASNLYRTVNRLLDETVFEPDKRRWQGDGHRKLQLGFTKEPMYPADWSRATQTNMQLYLALHACICRKFPEHEWTSIFINLSCPERVHTDSNNSGQSAIMAFGDYEGGEFAYWPGSMLQSQPPPELHDEGNGRQTENIHFLHGTPLIFDGSDYHSAMKATKGDRKSVVFYAREGCKSRLGGKNCPAAGGEFVDDFQKRTAVEIKKLKRLLARKCNTVPDELRSPPPERKKRGHKNHKKKQGQGQGQGE